ncbi:TIGR04282 family arsenosugar biosynthesis glycosyltransferase [Seonamhaeicola maritimus]|uniref:Glycosyltransferase n=1 Tax=Seonamhaeicola maritimus TaxID=2591822 RepID=A0A5C7GGA1_9FLAO|nr:TIGR04282 family arsenosugar biosynthesis glycosyltransferase [Seonamhaeicola maritimus]TXG36608.1 glycosyltransferase [Seonamhaeicola maritimus]
MSKELVIVFVKNIKLGKVKTRLAKTIGNEAAFEVYKELVAITKNVIDSITTDVHIYFSDAIVDSEWIGYSKSIQNGMDLGDRMKNAFNDGFNYGYNHIILIGSDLPEIKAKHIEKGFLALKEKDTVFGPAADGGYYLVGMSKMNNIIFQDKPWSQANLLEETLNELTRNSTTFTTLETLNDIDTYKDLEASSFYKLNVKLQDKIKQLND